MRTELRGLDEQEAIVLLKARRAFVKDGVPARDTIDASELDEAGKDRVASRLAPGAC